MAAYWVTANGKQIGLPFDDLEAAKRFSVENFGEDDTVLCWSKSTTLTIRCGSSCGVLTYRTGSR